MTGTDDGAGNDGQAARRGDGHFRGHCIRGCREGRPHAPLRTADGYRDCASRRPSCRARRWAAQHRASRRCSRNSGRYLARPARGGSSRTAPAIRRRHATKGGERQGEQKGRPQNTDNKPSQANSAGEPKRPHCGAGAHRAPPFPITSAKDKDLVTIWATCSSITRIWSPGFGNLAAAAVSSTSVGMRWQKLTHAAMRRA